MKFMSLGRGKEKHPKDDPIPPLDMSTVKVGDKLVHRLDGSIIEVDGIQPSKKVSFWREGGRYSMLPADFVLTFKHPEE